MLSTYRNGKPTRFTRILSTFSYCPLLWKFCGKAASNRINQLHKRALRVLQSDYTSTFEALLVKSGEATIHCSSLQKLMIETHYCTNYISPAVLTEFFRTKEISYDLRIKPPPDTESKNILIWTKLPMA